MHCASPMMACVTFNSYCYSSCTDFHVFKLSIAHPFSSFQVDTFCSITVLIAEPIFLITANSFCFNCIAFYIINIDGNDVLPSCLQYRSAIIITSREKDVFLSNIEECVILSPCYSTLDTSPKRLHFSQYDGIA